MVTVRMHPDLYHALGPFLKMLRPDLVQIVDEQNGESGEVPRSAQQQEVRISLPKLLDRKPAKLTLVAVEGPEFRQDVRTQIEAMLAIANRLIIMKRITGSVPRLWGNRRFPLVSTRPTDFGSHHIFAKPLKNGWYINTWGRQGIKARALTAILEDVGENPRDWFFVFRKHD